MARALGKLALIASALEQGDLQYSSVRALTRVATPATEQRWHDAAIAMRWKPAIVHTAIDAACVHADAEVTFDWLIREALRRCPIPT